MSIKSLGAAIFAKRIRKKINKWADKPVATQKRVFKELLETAKDTAFGKDHYFDSIKTYDDFVKKVPIRDYEALRSYVDRVVQGESDILWPGKPVYFAKTSGTTSGAKYIPITESSIKNQVEASRNAILNYIYETGECEFCRWKNDFSSGEPHSCREKWNKTRKALRYICTLCT